EEGAGGDRGEGQSQGPEPGAREREPRAARSDPPRVDQGERNHGEEGEEELAPERNEDPGQQDARDDSHEQSGYHEGRSILESTNPRQGEVMLPEYTSTALLDYALPANETGMRAGLETVRARLGKSYPLVIDGKRITTPDHFQSANPANPS